MKTEPSRTLREVWAWKEAVQEETRGMNWHEYFKYIHEHAPKLDLPVARPRRRAGSGSKSGT